MGSRTSSPANSPLRCLWNHVKYLHLFPELELNCPLDSKSEWSIYDILNSSFILDIIICLIVLVIIKYICGRPGEWKGTFSLYVFPFFPAKPNTFSCLLLPLLIFSLLSLLQLMIHLLTGLLLQKLLFIPLLCLILLLLLLLHSAHQVPPPHRLVHSSSLWEVAGGRE